MCVPSPSQNGVEVAKTSLKQQTLNLYMIISISIYFKSYPKRIKENMYDEWQQRWFLPVIEQESISTHKEDQVRSYSLPE